MPDTHTPPPGRYRFDEQIAAGGFGAVWRGTDVALGRTVAIKVLRLAHAQDPATLARFRAEARHAAALCHPNIAAIHDFCEPAPPAAPFLVMEYVAGPSLATLLAGGPLGAATVMRILAGAAAGLAAAHQAGLVHRDIKPGNILFDRDGRVKLTDFGISQAAGSTPLTTTGMLIGTPGYMAPERIAGARGSHASDIYSLGVVAYQALTGAPPFSGTPLEVAMAQRERPLPPLPAAVPVAVSAFIMQLTAKDPAGRPHQASDVALRAERLHTDLSGRPAPVARRIRARGRRRTEPARFLRYAAVMAAATVATLAGIYLAANASSVSGPGAAAALSWPPGPSSPPQRPAGQRSSAPRVAAPSTAVSLVAAQSTALAARHLAARHGGGHDARHGNGRKHKPHRPGHGTDGNDGASNDGAGGG